MTATLETHASVLKSQRRSSVDRITVRLIECSGRERLANLTVDGAADSTLEGDFGPLRFRATVDWHVEERRLRVELTVHNPRRARHRGGFWDLGDPGSVLLRGLCLEVPFIGLTSGDHTGLRKIEWIEHAEDDVHQTTVGQLEIYQESSGGGNWNSRNHVNRDGNVPMQFQGYRVRTSDGEHQGLRANPVVAVTDGEQYVACALEEFWQQFPSALEVDQQIIRVWLWPQQFPGLHELQAGEKNTRVIWFQFGNDGSLPWQSLQEVHDPAPPSVDRGALVKSGVAPFLPPADASVREQCRVLLREALEGERSFFAKREVIDEYGWRNFGDVYADHEAVGHSGDSPLISHYNNQYDCLAGFACQFLSTADPRWLDLMNDLAAHV
ncbi:MAG: hypothetical protein IID45_13080, partial [Planctomycetes bacterium]|nr:hypothetical protein [Planctomycetota bacterium]